MNQSECIQKSKILGDDKRQIDALVSLAIALIFVAFSWATVLAEEYKDKPFIGIVSYALAACTAFARVYNNKHWVSDVFVGAVLSHFITKKIVALHAVSDGRSVSIQPSLSGISLTFHF